MTAERLRQTADQPDLGTGWIPACPTLFRCCSIWGHGGSGGPADHHRDRNCAQFRAAWRVRLAIAYHRGGQELCGLHTVPRVPPTGRRARGPCHLEYAQPFQRYGRSRSFISLWPGWHSDRAAGGFRRQISRDRFHSKHDGTFENCTGTTSRDLGGFNTVQADYDNDGRMCQKRARAGRQGFPKSLLKQGEEPSRTSP
jgi:hypothetical protein